MSSSAKTIGTNLARVALLGFALEPLLERKARAYYVLPIAALAGSTITSGTTTAGGVVLLVWLVRSSQDDDIPCLEPTAMLLIDSALVSSEGDLGMQVTLLAESPTAFAQLDREVADGQGPGLDALATATGLSAQRVAEGWGRARAVSPEVEGPEQAAHVVSAFLVDVAPELQVDRKSHAELAAALVRERSAPDFPASARTHAWLAGWLGVPVDAVGDATQSSLAALPLVRGMEPRALLYASPDAFLVPFAAELEAKHKDALDARVASLVKHGAEALPESTRASLVASTGR